MSDELAIRRKRAFYRAHHRGTQEMDLLLGSYAAAKLEDMGAQELDMLEQLMDQPDPDLQRMLMAPAADHARDVSAARSVRADGLALIAKIRAFHGLGSCVNSVANDQNDNQE